MMMYRVNIVCLLALAFACCAESGCSCGPQHPQQALCDDNTFGEYCMLCYVFEFVTRVQFNDCASLFQASSRKYLNVCNKVNSSLYNCKCTCTLICASKSKRNPPFYV